MTCDHHRVGVGIKTPTTQRDPPPPPAAPPPPPEAAAAAAETAVDDGERGKYSCLPQIFLGPKQSHSNTLRCAHPSLSVWPHPQRQRSCRRRRRHRHPELTRYGRISCVMAAEVMSSPDSHAMRQQHGYVHAGNGADYGNGSDYLNWTSAQVPPPPPAPRCSSRARNGHISSAGGRISQRSMALTRACFRCSSGWCSSISNASSSLSLQQTSTDAASSGK